MRKFFLSSGFALFLLGTVALSSAEARPWWRRGWYDSGYYYPAYSYQYVTPQTYVVPQTSYYYAPEATTYYAPAYSTYYATPGYVYRPYYGRYWYGGRRGGWGWRR